ncbi:MAG: class I SAM-dependent methyltransferase, partial [Pseudorhodoplanes sp.]
MDRIYRHQRHIYDVTRRFFLLGRDAALRELQPPRPGAVLEIGCGTGRNLIAAARRYPQALFCGIDISNEMLKSCRRSVARAGLS